MGDDLVTTVPAWLVNTWIDERWTSYPALVVRLTCKRCVRRFAVWRYKGLSTTGSSDFELFATFGVSDNVGWLVLRLVVYAGDQFRQQPEKNELKTHSETKDR